ncbi:MAG: hypothetical protein HYV36_08000, partial [Lentisphaerae bacterium]|nr:hypothetical protein [Lentisphaerota bacterium]
MEDDRRRVEKQTSNIEPCGTRGNLPAMLRIALQAGRPIYPAQSGTSNAEWKTMGTGRRMTEIRNQKSGINNPITGALEHCELCPRRCGVNRAAGQSGYCRSGTFAQIFRYGAHYGEEPPIAGSR